MLVKVDIQMMSNCSDLIIELNAKTVKRLTAFIIAFIKGQIDVVKLRNETILHCLKITQNVAFEFLNFGIFLQF